MGGGASNSNRSSQRKPQRSTQKRASLPDHVLEKLQVCLLSLPFPPGVVDEPVIDRAADLAERVELLEPQVILTKGQKAKGIYIIIAGTAQVVSSSGNVIADLSSGDLFGELSTLFQIPCTATVKTPTKVLLLLLRPEALKAALNGQVVSSNLLDYFVKKRYLDTSRTVDQSELMHRIAKDVLKEVPLFKQWGDTAVEALVKAVQSEGPAVTLVPAGSVIATEDDPPDEIVVIIRGRVDVLKEKELLTSLDSARWPVWHGEEGLFTGSSSLVSLKTASACKMIIIKNAVINEVVKKHKMETASDFTKRLDKWRLRMAGSAAAKKVYACYLLEVLIQRLSETALLSHAPLDALYKIAINSRTVVHQTGECVIGEASTSEQQQTKMVKSTGSVDASSTEPPIKIDPTLPPGVVIKAATSSQVFWADDTFLLVLKGAVILNKNEEWVCEDGEVLWVPKAVLPRSRLEAKKDCVILKFTGSTLDEACGDYPDTKLTVPSVVRL
ncbi:uncharacterized protein LOC110981514 isoform X2 [Acanthaster planci]|uniref:Uncharacterized protein LOC110981514 isoform X2 n=1 Tax=Acanthaster planci TaxID=133434 RepID=A0A8B7YQ62_ACAPL|nr:uncharacterized protein LOC110981514 isoform X2 [Acanthaster planci]